MATPDESYSTPAASVLAGQIHALVTLCQVLVATHPDLNRLRAHLDVAEQAGLANIERLPVDDRIIRGYQQTMGQIRKALEDPPEIP